MSISCGGRDSGVLETRRFSYRKKDAWSPHYCRPICLFAAR